LRLGPGETSAAGATISTKRLYAMRRFLVLAASGIFAPLVLLAHAQGQGRPEAIEAAQKPKVRVLAIGRTPLADAHLPEGGVIVALVRGSLSRTGPGDFAGREIEVRWTSAALTQLALSDPSIDISLPLGGADCEQPNDLSQASAVLCDNTTFSDPILQVVMGVFTPSDSTFKFDTDESIFGKTICLLQEHDLSAFNADGRNWVSYKRVAVLRRPTLLDCVASVQAREAHAFVATDLEGRYVLGRLGLTELFAMQARPLATRGVHAVVSREHPQGSELISVLNRGLKELKQSEAYSAIVQKHLMRLWDGPAGVPSTAMAAAAPLTIPGAEVRPKPLTVAPPVRQAPKVAAPAIGPGDRDRALRFLKKGDEELADGRVAPARLLYERAAEMGLARAAMALAATYDAAELARLNLWNVQPDAAQARRWYEHALSLGAEDAGERLQRLGAK